MRIIVTGQARTEVRAIGRYVAEHSPRAAEKLIDQLMARCLALSDAPNRGAVVATRNRVEIRRLVEGAYLIFYSVSSETIRIHRVIHGARSPAALLKNIDPS